MIEAHLHRGLTWQKAQASQAMSMCLEVAQYADGIAVRDSKAPHEGALYYTQGEFAAFVQGCRNGEFDHLL